MQSDYLYPAVGDRRSPNDWTERGAQDVAARAAARVREILAGHHPSHVPEAVDEEIRRKFPVRLPRAAMSPAAAAEATPAKVALAGVKT